MNKFVQGVNRGNNWKSTENGADALTSTSNPLLDLFGVIGAMRTRPDQDVEAMFSNAFEVDKLATTKLAFYSRNIRGGLGERRVSRVMWKWLAKNYPEIMIKNVHLVPLFGRWDDLYCFIGTKVEPEAWKLIISQLNDDLVNFGKRQPISLMAKWLKSVNTSSRESVKLGKLTAQVLGMSEGEYRKTLSALRSYLKVVEKAMSSKDWSNINYSQVPSKAMTNYRKAFSRNDPSRFVAYLESVKKGEAKINSGTLYPYDIVEKIIQGEKSDVLEEQWKALPNYVEGENNMLVMADTSGSMTWHGNRPLATSVGLAIYFAERNHGAFKNMFMTFSSTPKFITLKSKSLFDKFREVQAADFGGSTNIEAAFREILRVAVQNKVPQSDMPKALIIISDMEFDTASGYGYYGRSKPKETYQQKMSALFAQAGYEMPKVVYWNVEARQNTFHAEEEDGVQFASGQATSVFKSIINGSTLSAVDMMMQTLNDPVYDVVTI